MCKLSYFIAAFQKMKSAPDTYYVTVIEDVNTGDVIGTATLLLEQKIIRGCGKVGVIFYNVSCEVNACVHELKQSHANFSEQELRMS